MDTPPAEGRLLESWKEISAYLKRSERTCRRWEETLALPVHRLDGTPNARVFAYTGELDRWLRDKLHHLDNGHGAEEAAARLRPRRRRLIAGSGLTAVMLIVLGGVLFRPTLAPPVPEVKPSIAILPFANFTGDVSLDPWQTALADLIIVDLEQSRYVNVVGITDLLRALVALKLETKFEFSDADIKAIAASLNVDHLATGRLTGSGRDRGLLLTVHDFKPGSSRPPRRIRTGFESEARAFAAADVTSNDIKLALDLTPAHVSRDLDRAVTRVSTSSPLAFKLFSQGYRLAGIEDYQQGTALLLKAIGQDPAFALAYFRLFRACENSRRDSDAKTYADAAFRLADRMSERDRWQFVWLYHDRYTADKAKMTEALERLCGLYPDDRFGSLLMLGVYYDRQDWVAGLPFAERAHAANRGDLNAVNRLAQFLENMGRAGEAERELSGFIEENPNTEKLLWALYSRARLRLRMGKFEPARTDLNRRDAMMPNSPRDRNFQARILLYEGRTEEAERIIRQTTETVEAQNQGGLVPEARARDMAVYAARDRVEAFLAWSDLCLLKGRFGQALDKLRRGLDIVDPMLKQRPHPFLVMEKIVLHFERAYLLRLTGRLEEAFGEIEAAIRACPRPGEDLFVIVMGDNNPGHPPGGIWDLKGQILLEMGRMGDFETLAADVKAALQSGKEPELQPIYLHLLGCRELKAGHPDKAIEHLTHAIDLTSMPGLSDYGPNPAPFYDLARAYVQKEGPDSLMGVAAFEKVTGPSVDRLSAGDLYALSCYQIGRACDLWAGYRYVRAYEIRRYLDRAIAGYRQFLGLWGEADPPFTAQVEEARRRLAALEAQVPAGKPRG